MSQLVTMATVMPAIFLGVTAFLVSIVLSRQVATQRAQIGMLKAVGYGGARIALHFCEWVGVVAVAGAAAGDLGGLAMGRAMARTYGDYYHLPALAFEGEAGFMAAGLALALAAALLGALGAVRTALRLPPAEAMRPAAPPTYRRSVLDRSRALRLVSPAARMVLRDLLRRPLRAAAAVAGLACAVAILLFAWFADDAIGRILFDVLEVGQHQTATVTFTHALEGRATTELRALPGVRRVEPFRAWPVVLRNGARSYRLALVGREPDAVLTRAVDAGRRAVSLPTVGLLVSGKLADLLAVAPGGSVEAELLDGARRVRTLHVAVTVDDYLGVQATASLPWLEAALADPGLVSGAELAIEPGRGPEVQAALAVRPRVAGVTMRAATVKAYRALVQDVMGVYLGIVGALALAIAAGVVYNSGRVTFSERERELATLRVIGFTPAETWWVVAGELLLHALLAVPVGFAFGRIFVGVLVEATSTDLYRLPAHVAADTYALAALAVLSAAALVSLVALSWVRGLDLVETLKQRE